MALSFGAHATYHPTDDETSMGWESPALAHVLLVVGPDICVTVQSPNGGTHPMLWTTEGTGPGQVSEIV